MRFLKGRFYVSSHLARFLFLLLAVMIYLYSGTPGSGKSLHAVSEMLRFERKGRPVIANFRLNGKALSGRGKVFYSDNDNLTPQKLEQYSALYWSEQKTRVKEDSILLVIDECQLVFNARDWQKNKRWIGFFTQHRKMGYEIILVAQQREMIDKQIRAVIEFEFKHRKLIGAGIATTALSLILGTKFLYKKELAQIRSVGKGANLGFKLAYYGRRTFRAYDTFKTW